MMIVLLALTMALAMTAAAEATSATKSITVDYQDIQIYVNGNVVPVQANEEPFIYEGRTFVPIRFVAEALNLDVEWLDWIKAVQITGAESGSLAEKDAEIEALKLQLSQKDAEIQSLKAALEKDDDEIADLEDDLLSDYDYLEDVEIEDISLDGDEDEVEVTIEVDLDEYGDEWEDLDDSDIEDWLDDLVSDIQDALSEDTLVTGEIIDIDSDDVLVEFEKDGDDRLEVDFYDEDYRDGGSDSDVEDVEDSLDGDSFYVGNIEFEITDIYYDDDDDSVTATLKAYDDDASSEWEAMSSSSIERDVKDICEEIADTFEDDADVRVDTVLVSFYDEDGYRLDKFEYDVDNDELD